ncbi:MAG: nitroreductase family protein [Pseudomonadales bacterium]
MNVLEIDAAAARGVKTSDFAELHPQFPGRWSPRALAGGSLTGKQMETLLEAARWAPSCFNEQPWRIAYALRGDDRWPVFFDVLVEGNQTWAVNAGALLAFAARRDFERNGRPNPVHAFDTGSAWMSLALQARHMGLVAHGMLGFDREAARERLELPDGYELCAMVAVGTPGDREDLPEALRERESPSPRKPLVEIAFRGGFSALTG